MRAIPVIDILNGVVVHAVRGKRKEYKPLRSVLMQSVNPVTVASALKKFGFGELYLADLDAIMRTGQNLSVIRQIAEETSAILMVDAGVTDLNQARQLLQNKVSKLIVGTETLQTQDFLKDAIDFLGSEKIIVSLDLKAGKVLSKSESIRLKDPLTVARELEASNVAELIVIDLARVGTREGVDLLLLEEMRENLNIKLLVGGGVRDVDDLVDLEKLGIDGVLLATALHSGQISREDLTRMKMI